MGMTHINNALEVSLPWHMQNAREHYQRKIIDTREKLDMYERKLIEVNEIIKEYLAPYETLRKAPEGSEAFPVLTSYSK